MSCSAFKKQYYSCSPHHYLISSEAFLFLIVSMNFHFNIMFLIISNLYFFTYFLFCPILLPTFPYCSLSSQFFSPSDLWPCFQRGYSFIYSVDYSKHFLENFLIDCGIDHFEVCFSHQERFSPLYSAAILITYIVFILTYS